MQSIFYVKLLFNVFLINKCFSQPNNSRVSIDFSMPAQLDSGLLSVFDLILRTISADWVYLEEIFDAPRSVMDTLLKRVFEEIVRLLKLIYLLLYINIILR